MLASNVLDKLIIKVEIAAIRTEKSFAITMQKFIKLFHIHDVITMETATILVYKEVVASMVILVDGKRYL